MDALSSSRHWTSIFSIVTNAETGSESLFDIFVDLVDLVDLVRTLLKIAVCRGEKHCRHNSVKREIERKKLMNKILFGKNLAEGMHICATGVRRVVATGVTLAPFESGLTLSLKNGLCWALPKWPVVPN